MRKNKFLEMQLKDLDIPFEIIDKKEVFCGRCNKRVEYTIEKHNFEVLIHNHLVKFVGKIAKCSECEEEVYPTNINDENLLVANNKYRELANIITINQIKLLLKKYNIGAAVLSKLLGWSEVTIQRYKEGRIPTKKYSDKLLRLLKDPKYMENIVESNKNIVTSVAYKKVRTALDSILESSIDISNNKLISVTNYILKNEFSNKSLQKLLYFVQGFSLAFKEEPIFYEVPEAWIHGPVYRDIYNKYKDYGYEPIEKNLSNNFILEFEDKILIDSVLKYFGCFTPNKLEAITHSELPWIKNRTGLSNDEPSYQKISLDDMRSYFKDIKIKYHMVNYNDIKSYAIDQI